MTRLVAIQIGISSTRWIRKKRNAMFRNLSAGGNSASIGCDKVIVSATRELLPHSGPLLLVKAKHGQFGMEIL